MFTMSYKILSNVRDFSGKIMNNPLATGVMSAAGINAVIVGVYTGEWGPVAAGALLIGGGITYPIRTIVASRKINSEYKDALVYLGIDKSENVPSSLSALILADYRDHKSAQRFIDSLKNE